MDVRAVAFFHLTCVVWMIFRVGTWQELFGLVSAIATPTDWMNVSAVNVRLLVASILIIFIIDLWNEAKLKLVGSVYARVSSCMLAVVAIVPWSPESVSSFIYFQF